MRIDWAFLKNRLRQNKITRAKFAEMIGVPVGTLNGWFFRKSCIPISVARRIENIFGLEPDCLIEWPTMTCEIMNPAIKVALQAMERLSPEAQGAVADLIVEMAACEHFGRDDE